MKTLQALKLGLVLAAIPLGACASTSVIRTGPTSYSTLPDNVPVVVFADERDVPQRFDVVGLLRYVNPGKYQILNTSTALPEVERQARVLGANAIILDSSEVVKSGIISTGVVVTARAVRLRGA
jgi:hypothetical protein